VLRKKLRDTPKEELDRGKGQLPYRGLVKHSITREKRFKELFLTFSGFMELQRDYIHDYSNSLSYTIDILLTF
jgi:hypothetical protein